MKKQLKNAKGITLIALVITIIVLLILAGVSIAMLTGDNGIITQANKSKVANEKATAKEKVQVEVGGSRGTDGKLDYSLLEDNLNNIKDIEGVPSPITKESFPLEVTVDGYTVKIEENGTVTVEGDTTTPTPPTTGKTDGSYDTTKGVNTPKLDTGMKLVKYDEATKEWVEDTTNYEYSYTAQAGRTDTYNEETGEYGTSHWANAEVNGNYYVWIPRYAYKIDKNTSYTTQGGGTSYKIDVKFLVGTENKYYDESGELVEAKIATSADEILSTSNTDYYVHPAFTFGDKELEGLWIGKYETSGSTGTPTIQPNQTSLSSINVSTMFSTAQKLSTANGDAHMLKNTEWGAAAYLAQSQYGRNGTEISVNQCSSFITGAGRGIGTGTDNPIWNSKYSLTKDTIKGTEQEYNGKIGKLSSTTGNVYGIYDMSGGAYEYVMGMYQDSNGNIHTGYTTSSNSGFNGYLNDGTQKTDGVDLPESKYYNLYTTKNNTNIGDALYETSGWNADYSIFVGSSGPFFKRGGYCDYTSFAGVFLFSSGSGDSDSDYGFRVCLAVK